MPPTLHYPSSPFLILPSPAWAHSTHTYPSLMSLALAQRITPNQKMTYVDGTPLAPQPEDDICGHPTCIVTWGTMPKYTRPYAPLPIILPSLNTTRWMILPDTLPHWKSGQQACDAPVRVDFRLWLGRYRHDTSIIESGQVMLSAISSEMLHD